MVKTFCYSLVCILSLISLLNCNNQNRVELTSAKGTSTCPLDEFGCVFMPIAGSAGIFEVELGKVAAQRAIRSSVKKYAALMIEEHSAINEEYRKLMRRKGMVPPDTMMRVHLMKIDSLKWLPANQIDSRYAKMMVADHKMAVEMFNKAYKEAQDPEYKAWLKPMLKVVRMHYKHAQTLLKSIVTTL
ncbi:DUF4142 domain-containing protein [Hymenobacter taeanensis]|uniref:DUF4142 domain-containing protein n=1 Tax=Hymenobacter taeanensis TaxID=2735321 RepID=A0A6M6BHF6_9BACT|nr:MULTISPECIES: DUF4142 domain-containing protein [Hymenobacter]QJX47328.1 DUF4142 domain-containing protein [Hymenobacter taeanensis]UOQ79335.1 DUF4142 domain-containing protein [Hymenobacter sp. 5414T-23]